MKYKVIGWTSDDNSDYLEKDNTLASNYSILEEIIKKHYYFTGEHHQKYDECVPILNDGYKRSFSRRGWALLMAQSYNKTEEYDYASYMDIDYSNSYRFPDANIKKNKIKDINDLKEIFKITPSEIINIDETSFNITLKGLKKI